MAAASASASASVSGDEVHVLVFPFISTGHLVPLLDLTHRLLSSGCITATVIITPPNLPLLQPLLSSHPPSSLQTLLLTPPPLPTLPTPSPPHLSLPARILSLRSLSPKIISWFQSHPSPPVAIISDFFLGWTHHLARDLHIPRISFSPSGALGISVYYSLWKYLPQNPNPANTDTLIPLQQIPGRPEFPWWQLSHVYTGAAEADSRHPYAEFFKDSMVANMASWGTILNTFSDFESDYVHHLKSEVAHPARVWTVGPLLPSSEEDSDWAKKRSGPTSLPAQEVMTWLDRRPDSSVVYVCFGSREELSEEQTAALEAALGRCRAEFIWCPGRSGGGGSIVGERGLVVRGWAPQVEILRHRAVAAFVTHCGWNSVMEAVSAGVAMVAWPMGADQFADANLIVEELGLGVRVPCDGSGSRNVPDPDELARVMDGAVDGTRPKREAVRRMRSLAAETVKEGGSSYGNLAHLVRWLKELSRSKLR